MHFVTGRRAALCPGRYARAALVAGATLLAVAVGPAAAARAELVITDPLSGSYTKDTEPTFAGTVVPMGEEVEFCVVEVSLYAGEDTTGPALQHLPETFGGCSWLTGPAATLEQGTYTAVAQASRYEDPESEAVPETSPPVTFTIDTTPPTPTIGSPSPGAVTSGSSVSVSGSSTAAPGDLPTVTVQVFSGPAPEGAPVQAIEVPVADGAWSGTIAGLPPGSYTLRAQQADSAGNVGFSQPVALQVVAPVPPRASFTWFPASPEVGEPVALVASWSAVESPITGFAWALGSGAPFLDGRPTLTTSFTTPGPHVVLLKVTDAAGRTSQAAETISVRHHRATLMQPFPIVRIAGRETRAGVRLTLLTVTAPVSSRVTVSVRGGKGRSSSESRLATVRKPTASATVVMSFPRFARPLRAGAVLEVRVTKAGQIGKLTRFIPHRGRLPTRQDICLGVSGKPSACPSS